MTLDYSQEQGICALTSLFIGDPSALNQKDVHMYGLTPNLAEWAQIVTELEDLDDIRAYDAAQQHTGDRIPFEQAVREIRQDYKA